LKEERKLSVGAYLSQERKRQNISLLDIAKVTRISPQYLEALEENEFQTLPASIFVRGFLRTYAAQIGLDPKEVLNMYEAQSDSFSAPARKETIVRRKKLEPLVKYLLTLLIIVLGVSLAFLFFFKETSVPPSPSSSPEIPPAQTPLAKKDPSATLPSPEKEPSKELAPAKPEEKPGKLPAAGPMTAEEARKKEKHHVLKVNAIERTWLRIQADDEPEFEALLQPKEMATWTARRQFKILLGNAGGVEISLDGNLQGPLGESGQVISLLLPNEITPPEEEKEEQ
jgi:cytoskeleton protein RodZ